jgi:transposase
MIRLTDEQWERIRNHFPEEHIADGRPGRKPIPTRRVLEAVLWLLNTGAQWHMLPQSYPNYKTVHRRFQAWCRDEILRRLLTDVANELRDRGALDEEGCFIDATFVMAKGGGAEIGATKRGKGMKIMACANKLKRPLDLDTSLFQNGDGDVKDTTAIAECLEPAARPIGALEDAAIVSAAIFASIVSRPMSVRRFE